MAKYSRAYSHFVQRLNEVQALQKLAKRHSSVLGRNPGLSNTLCRSGVVLLCSHVEGFIEELIEIILQRIVSKGMDKEKLPSAFFFFMSKDIIDSMNQTIEPSKISEKMKTLLQRDRDIWSSKSQFEDPLPADRFLRNFATPRFENINSLIRRFGYTTFKADIQSSLRADGMIAINMLDQVVQQRNKIAHGDNITTSTHQDLGNMIILVKKFCHTTDQVVGAWFANNGCPIR